MTNIHYINAPAPMVIVKIEQPPEDATVAYIYPERVVFSVEGVISTVHCVFYPLPLGAKVGVKVNMTTGLNFKADVPIFTVTSVAVKQVKELTFTELTYLPADNVDPDRWVEIAGLEEK